MWEHRRVNRHAPRPLGRTGLRVSPVGLGMAALGRPGYINLGHRDDLGPDRDRASLEARAHDVLDAALAEGVRYVDCARSYGRSEEFVASWLAGRGDDARDVVVGSKWGYRYTAGWRDDADVHEVKEHTRAHLDAQWAETRAALGDRVLLYQIHSATRESGVLEDADVIDGLRRIREGGVAIGLTTSGPHQADTVSRAIGLGVFDAVQSTFNVLESSVGEALAAAHAAGMGVIVKEAVANGRLTDRGDADRFAARAELLGASPDAVAIAWVLAHPFVDCVLSGASTRAHLRSNLVGLDLDVDPAAFADLSEDPQDYWGARSGLEWN
ncbi:MAG: aldo/keto reductase [Thermoleophilia bacterium]|nr:aldo/keto reductase [Thermoleophilia bacterium]